MYHVIRRHQHQMAYFELAMCFVRQLSTKLFTLVLLLVVGDGSGLLCYNGTLTSARFGEDPLSPRSLFNGGVSFARLRCSMTTRCEVGLAAGLNCFNCSETQQETNQCAGSFGTGSIWFNASRLRLATCTGEHAMCFVRSWSARAKHAWLVQRGCYKSSPDDPLPRTVRSPTRAMSCKRERYKDAEYRVCLCQADWCNSAKSTLCSWLHTSTFVGLANVLWYLS